MKTILLFLAITSLFMPQRPAPQKNRTMLFDFRDERSINSNGFPAATQRNVFAKMFRRYLTDESKCSAQFNPGNASDYLAAARKAGQIAPSIFDVERGSFTAAGQTQTAYLVAVNECGATHADNYGSKRIAIFAGQQLVADIDVDFKSSIVRKSDLDGDGIDELLLSGGDMGQGTLIEVAALVTFQNGRQRVIQDFGTVVEDDCASARPGSTSKASVLYFGADGGLGTMPKLTQENFVSGCQSRKRWRFVSSGRMTE